MITKNVHGNKKRASEKNVPISQNKDHKGHMKAKCYLLWDILVLNCCVCLVWPCMALYDRVWSHSVLLLFFATIAICGLIRLSMPCVTQCGLVWPCMAWYGLFMVLYVILWSFVAIYCLFSRSQIQINLVLFSLKTSNVWTLEP